jgi:dTDP-4-amino-4,6-dideoxygalactose transaminase
VITAPNTDITTCAAISHCGATVVWADVDEGTFNLDPTSVAEHISPRTRVIIAVHLYGLPADLTCLQPLAARHDVALIEDAALAFGAKIGSRHAGSIGLLGCFSFAPHKVLGAYGDGGMIVTDNATLARKARLLGGYGEPYRDSMVAPDGRVNVLVEGHHNHLDLVQAAILRVKLRHVDRWIGERRKRAALYDTLLAGSSVITPRVPVGFQHVYRNYVVRVPQRDRVRAQLAERGISTGLLYLPPLHLQPAYQARGFGPGSFPVTERLADELLCLPMYPELSEDAVRRVALELLHALEDVTDDDTRSGRFYDRPLQ